MLFNVVAAMTVTVVRTPAGPDAIIGPVSPVPRAVLNGTWMLEFGGTVYPPVCVFPGIRLIVIAPGATPAATSGTTEFGEQIIFTGIADRFVNRSLKTIPVPPVVSALKVIKFEISFVPLYIQVQKGTGFAGPAGVTVASNWTAAFGPT